MDCIFRDNIIKSIIECDLILEELYKLEKYDIYYYLSISTIIICFLSLCIIFYNANEEAKHNIRK
jgi:hypothetical protein